MVVVVLAKAATVFAGRWEDRVMVCNRWSPEAEVMHSYSVVILVIKFFDTFSYQL